MAYKVGKCLLPLLLKESRITQSELADKLNVTKQQVNKYSTNKRVMSLSTAKNVATILNCRVEELYEWIPLNEKGRKPE